MIPLFKVLLGIIVNWTLNIIYLVVFVFSFGKKTVHEAIYFPTFNLWANWSLTFFQPHANIVRPENEEEIARAVRDAKTLRVIGAGHSFNSSPLCDDTLLSLENYSRILEYNYDKLTVKVQAGMRLRDFIREIEDNHLSMETLGSTDAQTLGGLVATDLHGSARDKGFLSDQIVSIKIVDGLGAIKVLTKSHEAFFAVPGSIGTLGVVIELEIQCVRLYNMGKKITIVREALAEANIKELLERHDHLSFYYTGGAKIETCRMNTWDKTIEDESIFIGLKRYKQEIFDHIVAGFLLGLSKLFKRTDATAKLGLWIMKAVMSQNLVTTGGVSFVRKMYYRHDEIEYGVAFENYIPCLKKLLAMLNFYGEVCIIEIRFTPKSESLIGPGAGRQTVFLELAPSLSYDVTELFTRAELIFKEFGGQPHLGKWTKYDKAQMQKVHGDRFTKFLRLREKFDPHDKFVNDFVAQVFF